MDPQAVFIAQSGAQKIGKQVKNNIQKSAGINDLDRLYDLLFWQKNMMNNYHLAAMEAVDPSLANLLSTNRQRLQDQQAKLADTLFNMGEYTADLAPASQVKDVADTFMGYLNQLPYKTKMPH